MHLGHLHVAVVHFPIALAMAAAVADLLWWLTQRDLFRHAGLYCLAGAVLTIPAALLTGDQLADELFPPDIAPQGSLATLLEYHQIMAFVSLGVLAAAVVVRILWARKAARWQPVLYGMLMLALVACIGVTGDLGGKMVYGADWFARLFS
jgi:uncharacterized membrane protein